MFTWKVFILGCFIGFGETTSHRVLLGDVQTLSLKSNQDTLARRVLPVPQLNCVGGDGLVLAKRRGALPNVVQCKNQGSDGADAQWSCTAELESAFRMGVTNVVCEGYEYPDDPYVLTGSCGLEFTIELTSEGHRLLAQTNPSPTPVICGLVLLMVAVSGCMGGSNTQTKSSGPGFWTGAAVGSLVTSGLRGYRSSGGSRISGSSYRSTGFGGTRRR